MKSLTYPDHKWQLLVGIAISILLIPKSAWSQQAQFALETSSHTALVDQSRLKKEYKAFSQAKEKIINTAASKKRAFDQSIQEMEIREEQELTADAKNGSANKTSIIRKALAEKMQLTKNYNAEQKKIMENAKAQERAYENKINAVIQIIAVQGGFTEVKPLKKGEAGIDITSLVLEKLN